MKHLNISHNKAASLELAWLVWYPYPLLLADAVIFFYKSVQVN